MPYPIETQYTKKQYDPSPIHWVYKSTDPGFNPIQPDPGAPGTFVPYLLGGSVHPPSGSWPVYEDILVQAAGPPPAQGLVTNLFGGVNAYYEPSAYTFDGGTVHATENVDGTGAAYDLPAVASTVSPLTDGLTLFGQAIADIGWLSANVSNPTDRPLYIQSASGTVIRWVLIPVTKPIVPPPDNPPSVLPPGVTGNTLLEKANPGFVGDLTRHEKYDDLAQVFLGQKVTITAESVGMYLGFVNRGHVITMAHFHWNASGGDSPKKTFDSTFRVEKIPGTLLPGTGTSTPAQDAAGTGAEVSMTLRFNDTTSGFGMGNFAPG